MDKTQTDNSRGGTAQWVKRRIEKPGPVLTRVRFPHAARDFPPESAFSADSKHWFTTSFLQIDARSVLLMQTLLRWAFSPRVQTNASTSARTLKIPDTVSHSVVWTHKNISFGASNRPLASIFSKSGHRKEEEKKKKKKNDSFCEFRGTFPM